MLDRIFGSGQPEAVNIQTENFDPKSDRCWSHVDERLKNFEDKRKKLLALDMKLEAGMCCLPLCLWQLGWAGPVLSIVADVVLGYVVAQSYGRDGLRKEYDAALDELHAIYRWCARGQTPVLTHDPRFLAVLEAIIPFTQNWQTLVPWDLSNAAPHMVSDRYLEIFAQSPHRVTNLLPKRDNESSILSSLIGKKDHTVEVLKLPDVKESVTSSKWYQLFASVDATVKLNVYGHQFDLGDKEAQQLRKG